MSTMTARDVLEKHQGQFGVSQTQFRASRNDLSYSASWAIWTDISGDLSHFTENEEPWRRLRRDVVLLGGNAGVLPASANHQPEKFHNFHTPGHRGDGKLRNAVRQTPLSGAYMTDVIKDLPTPYSRRDPKTGSLGLLDLIEAGEVDLQKHFVDPLVAEISVLDLPRDVLFILLGKSTRQVWDTAIANSRAPRELISHIRTIDVPYHYTYPGNNRLGISGRYVDHLNTMLDMPL